jgi:hypothetical protein
VLPRREVTALVELVVRDDFEIRPLCPTLRGWIKLVRKDAHSNRDGDAFDIEIRELILPIKTGRRKRRTRQLEECDVVEHVVFCEAGGLSGKDA